MAQYYTLEEASQKLGISVAEFRRKLATEWRTSPRRYPDGATLRFQTREIDELARTLGKSSDPELSLGDEPLSLADEGDMPLILHQEPAKPAPKPAAPATKAPAEDLLSLADDDIHHAPLPKTASPSSRKIAKAKGPDSDVKLELAPEPSKPYSFSEESNTEEIDLDDEKSIYESGPRTNKVPVSSVPKKPVDNAPFELSSDSDLDVKPVTNKKVPDGSSEFELSLTNDSDFELSLTDDNSDEVALGDMPVTRDRAKGGDSGINLRNPGDSGISLEKSSDDFELNLEPELASGKIPNDHSDSEFELTLDDPAALDADATQGLPNKGKGKDKDIFETDFELPAASGLDEEAADTDMENSDFDLELDESALEAEASDSEIEALGDEELVAEELDELEVSDEDAVEEEEEEAPARAVAAGPPVQHAWGILPLLALFPSFIVLSVVGLMSWELVRGMWGYRQGKNLNGMVVKSIAEMVTDFKAQD